MADLLKGKPVADAIDLKICEKTASLKEKSINPALAVFRVGEYDDDLSYERGIQKKCEKTGIRMVSYVFPEDVSEDEFYQKLQKANEDPMIHGILVFRPLPGRFDDEVLRNSIDPSKDVDGCGDLSLAGVFTGKSLGFAPCTAQAVMEILNYYKIRVVGSNVVVLGRSLIIGRPVSMLLMKQNATVTICHTRTRNTAQIASKADILICSTGQMESITPDYVNENQTVIDVGIGWNEEKQKLCGDVLFDQVEANVKRITPVPGGVGSVTVSILCQHVIEACIRSQKQE
ncbi:MAG: bifunctional 5,10-methylene-tetrahydrofolate dehydrogenase/5,10-methylene-tetrahydrofolate cyclohydrolase [Erysipelotrichaceae bacterium]|nr:bifunctional 5,10-methylene-tetrahydrofolate dehydrogenase/5,10-methylene-tetrahydrofolate cyclohydrolase [Erysipelotrichaceae bacterium]